MVVRLNSGDTFRGQFGRTTQGMNFKSNITFEPYGSGNNPVIAGSIIISGWSSLGSNIWEATVTLPEGGNSRECGNNSPQPNQWIDQLFINGQIQTLARFPNSGYLNVTSSTGNNNFASSQLTQANGFFDGANVRIRTFSWQWQKGIVSTYTVGNVQLTGTLQNDGQGNTLLPDWGFFFDNKESFLDQQGEWFYNNITQKIKLYSTIDPNTLLIEGLYSGYLTSICIFFNNNVTVRDISVKHQYQSGIQVWLSNNVRIENIVQQYSYVGLEVLWDSENLFVDNSQFSYNLNTGIKTNVDDIFDWKGSKIQNSHVTESGTFPGLGRPAYATGTYNVGIRGNGGATPITFLYNYVNGTGRDGISLDGNIIFRNNFVTRACLTLNDCSGIVFNAQNLIVDGNFISDTYGNMEGSGLYNGQPLPRMSWGMRSHLGNNGASIINNVVYNNQAEGILVESTTGHTISNNIFFNNGNSARGKRQVSLESSTGTTVTGNVFISLQNGVYAGIYLNTLTSVTMNNNRYCHSNSSVTIIGEFNSNTYDLSQWKTFTSQESGSVGCPSGLDFAASSPIISLLTNPSLSINQYPQSSTYLRMYNSTISTCQDNTFSLYPYTGAVIAKKDSLVLPTCVGTTSNPQTNNPQTSNPQTNTPQTNNPQTNTPQTNNPQTNTPQTNNPQTSTPTTSSSNIIEFYLSTILLFAFLHLY